MQFTGESIYDFVRLAIILTIFGLYFKQWKPPLPKQVIAGVLLFLGAFLGEHLCSSAIMGFLISGLVFYKHDLINEINMTKSCFNDIKEIKLLRNSVNIKEN